MPPSPRLFPGVLLLLLLCASTALAACSPAKSSNNLLPSMRRGTLILANRGDPPSGFDSMRTTSIALHHVGGALFGGANLVQRCRDNMYLVCGQLAKSWVANPGYTEYTFAIRENVFWHDGQPLTAEDAKFWFDLAYFGARSGEKVRAPATFKGELGPIKSIELPDKNHVRVTFSSRNQYFVEALANPRLKLAHPKHLMQPLIDRGQVDVSPLDVGLVGTGPFKLISFEPGSKLEVKRFDKYWEKDSKGQSLPYLDGITYVMTPDVNAMDAAFRSGRLDGEARGDAHYLSLERRAAIQKDLGNQVFIGEMSGGTFRLAFNVLKPGPWQDARVRRAIALWIDKPAAIPSVLGGSGWTTPNTGPDNPYTNKLFLNWPRFDTDPLDIRRAEARRLLAEAGYANGFTMGHLCRSMFAPRCEFLKAQLLGLNIDLKLQVVDDATWNRERLTLNFESEQGALTPPLVPEATESVYGRYSQNPDAYTKHDDPQVEAFYQRLRTATNTQARVAIWREFEHYLYVEQTYVIPVAESIQLIAYRSYVKGLSIPPEDGHTHTDFATVWLDKK